MLYYLSLRILFYKDLKKKKKKKTKKNLRKKIENIEKNQNKKVIYKIKSK